MYEVKIYFKNVIFFSYQIRGCKNFLCGQIFIYNPESSEDNHLAQFSEKKLLPILANSWAADLFWRGLDGLPWAVG